MKIVLQFFSIIAIACCATLLLGASSEPGALPTGIVYGLAGEPLATEGIGTGKEVLLVLLKNGDNGREQLLTLIEGMKKPLPPDRVLVVAGHADETLLKTMADQHKSLPAIWYRDTDELLAKGLALNASPAIMGVRDGRVIWTRFGVADRDLLEKTMQGWLNR
jgi:hypothetical protein